MTENEVIRSFCMSFLSNERVTRENLYTETPIDNLKNEYASCLKNDTELSHCEDCQEGLESQAPKMSSSLAMTGMEVSKMGLNDQIRESIVKNFKCSFENCDKSFDYRWILERHVNSHFCFKLYKCEYEDCKQAYKSKENLNLHFRNKHLGEKPYPCRFCTLRFSHRNGKFI